MEFIHLLLLGIAQGLTAFLPVSGSAHMVVATRLLGWEEPGAVFEISLQLGALAAVLAYFRADVATMFAGLLSLLRGRYRDDSARLVVHLVAATLPVWLAGLMARHIVRAEGRDTLVIAATGIVFGGLLWYADRLAAKETDATPSIRKVADVTIPKALLWGVFQAVALIPGVSRSGICITAGRSMGATREAAAHFGSLMLIPTALLAVAAALADTSAASVNWHNAFGTLVLGVAMSFGAGLMALHVLMTWCNRAGYLPFVIYQVALGMALLAMFDLRWVS